MTSQGIKTITANNLFIIAEVGNQFGGSKQTALNLCKVAADAGADAVKFIFWFPDEILADKKQMYSYLTAEGTITEPMFDMLDRLRLPIQDWWEVQEECNRLGIIFFATVNSPSGQEWAEVALNIPIIKLSSWDYFFTDLFKWAGKTQKPVIVDTGQVYEDELDMHMKLLGDNLILMHCPHAKMVSQENLLSIPYMARRYGCLVGYSSTDYSDDFDIAAIGLGACAIEKRLTLSRQGGILHDAISKEPGEFKEYVKRMREIKSTLGIYGIKPSDNDLEQRKLWFRRIVADEDINKGDIILRPMLEAKRGFTGISPDHIWEFVGKKATRDIRRNEDVKYEYVEN